MMMGKPYITGSAIALVLFILLIIVICAWV